jgi:hypothetical protein
MDVGRYLTVATTYVIYFSPSLALAPTAKMTRLTAGPMITEPSQS